MIGHYSIYTDGACSGNPGDGGIAYIIVNDENVIIEEFSRYFPNTTNNRMELLAVIFAIKSLSDKAYNLTIYSDSTYVVNAINKGWLEVWEKNGFLKRKNADLWKIFIDISKNRNIKFVWVKGHADNFYNKKCDLLAKDAIKSHKLY